MEVGAAGRGHVGVGRVRRSRRRGGGPVLRGLRDRAGGQIVCHNDVCLENGVFRAGRAVGRIAAIHNRAGGATTSDSRTGCPALSTRTGNIRTTPAIAAGGGNSAGQAAVFLARHAAGVNLVVGEATAIVRQQRVSAEYFSVLGVPPRERSDGGEREVGHVPDVAAD